MGRKKRWSETILLTLPEGTKTLIDEALLENEDRLGLIRAALHRELRRRAQRRFLEATKAVAMSAPESSKLRELGEMPELEMLEAITEMTRSK